jgi:hypothetical protein
LIEDIDQLFMNLRSTVAALQLLVEKIQDEKGLQLMIGTARRPELMLDRELEIFTDIIPILYPDENERVEIIKVYTRGCELDDSFDLKLVAQNTEWWSGEEIRQLINTSKLDDNLINSALLSHNINEISERIESGKRVKRMQELLNFTKEHSNIKSIREDSLSRHGSLLTSEGEGCASRPQARLINNDELPIHANIEILLDRMDDALKRTDYSGVLHSSASIFETLAKEVVGVPSVQNQTLKSFFQKYRKNSLLPDAVLDFILATYDSRNVTPLAGHGSTATPSITSDAAITLAEMTKAFVKIEYRLRATKS